MYFPVDRQSPRDDPGELQIGPAVRASARRGPGRHAMRSHRLFVDAPCSSDVLSFLSQRDNNPRNVLGEHIELQIYEIPGFCPIKIRLTPGVRNDPRDEASRKSIGDGETDSVDSDGTLGSHIMRELSRQFDFELEICASLLEGDNGRDAINVALNEMSAQAGVSAQSAL